MHALYLCLDSNGIRHGYRALGAIANPLESLILIQLKALDLQLIIFTSCYQFSTKYIDLFVQS